MKDKQKQIEEMAKDIELAIANGKKDRWYIEADLPDWIAECLIQKRYRKIPENAVVLTGEEYERLGLVEETVQEYESVNGQPVLVKERKEVKKLPTDIAEFIRKETVEKFARRLKEKLHYDTIPESGITDERNVFESIDEITREMEAIYAKYDHKGGLISAVLISNKPKWCELIAIRKKFWELRKTKPKLKPPFKVYIYETKEKAFADIGIYGRTKDGVRYNFVHRIGKVIGEFICDEIREVYQCNSGWVAENACVTRSEFFDYLGIPQDTHFGYDKKAYAWHITDLKIYDEPKELSEFMLARERCKVGYSKCNKHVCGLYPCSHTVVKRPPQSWCYVEDLEGVMWRI